MTENWVSEVVSSLGCMYKKILTEIHIEYYRSSVATIPIIPIATIISVNIADTSIPKCVDNLRLKIQHKKNATLDTETLSVLS